MPLGMPPSSLPIGFPVDATDAERIGRIEWFSGSETWQHDKWARRRVVVCPSLMLLFVLCRGCTLSEQILEPLSSAPRAPRMARLLRFELRLEILWRPFSERYQNAPAFGFKLDNASSLQAGQCHLGMGFALAAVRSAPQIT